MKRRNFFKNAAIASSALWLQNCTTPQNATPLMLSASSQRGVTVSKAFDTDFLFKIRQTIYQKITSPVLIEAIDLVRTQKKIFVRVRSKDGIIGTSLCNERMENLQSLLKGLIVPFYMGNDAREIVALSEDVFTDDRNYKYGGMPFWNSAGSVEIAIWDLLGRTAKISVHSFLGEKKTTTLPAYLSSLTRETTAEHESNFLKQKLEETGAKAVKIKVGGRMKNTPETEARTQAFVPMARKILGENITIYADANGSYTPEEGVRIAQLLEANGIDIFEEPCAWENYSGNRQVNRKLKKMKLAGGEQDSSWWRWLDIAQTDVYSVLQPDLYYNGGIIRALKVAHLAAQNGKFFAPHSPKADPCFAPFSQVMAVAPSVYGFQEYPSKPAKQPNWYAPHIVIKNGRLPILEGVGLGIEYDDMIFDKAEKLG
jgi:L-alanine-DL-glutamate epimerase-like enolase superfamily enzyme